MKKNNKQIIVFLLFTFIVAYIIQFIAGYVYNNINMTIGQLIVAAMMFVPAIGAFVAGIKFKDIAWKLNIKKNLKYFFIAWLIPIVFTAIGTLLYFIIFPSHFSLNGEYLINLVGQEAYNSAVEAGLTIPLYIVISLVQVIIYGAFLNSILALGEEIGWRAFLYPRLKEKYGSKLGRILGGIIWGAWHFPLIWLIGYGYGSATGNQIGYFGFPFVGMLVFLVFTISAGIIHDWLYEKTGSIWFPSLLHGSINGVASIPLLMCIANTGTIRILGPHSVGLIGGIGFTIMAIIIIIKKDKVK